MTRTRRTTRTALTATLIAGALLLLAPTAEALETMKCWEAAVYDLDGDGYAQYRAHKDSRVSRLVPAHQALTCDPGWVPMRGDTDDTDPNVHPRRREVKNGIDDNCDGRVDEPTFFHYVTGLSNTRDGFTMRVRINHQTAIDAAFTPGLKLLYRLEYQRLSDTLRTFTTPLRSAAGVILKPGGSYARVDVRLGGLAEATVYRARVRFYLYKASTNRTYSIGEESTWYYSITDSGEEVGRARTRLVLRALYEHYLSEQTERAGYLGSEPDGTRYGGDMGEWWCSEFYSWVADYELDGMGHRSNAKKIAQYFADFGGWFWLEPGDPLLHQLEPADYLGVATGADPDKITHSAMFLAYDPGEDLVWSIDGNTNGYSDIGDSYANRRGTNETFVRSREGDSVVGAGHILERMLP